MKPETIASILESGVEDQPVMAFTARIKKVFGGKGGENDHGKFYLQNIIVQDLDNPKIEIKVKFDGHPDIPRSMEGQIISVSQTKGDRGWNGCKVKKDDYYHRKDPKKPIETILSVTPTAKVEFGATSGGSAQAQHPPQSSAPSGQRQQAAKPSDPLNAPAPERQKRTPKQVLAELKKFAGQQMNAEWQFITAADIIAEAYQQKHGEPMSQEQYAGFIGRIYIAAERRGFLNEIDFHLDPALVDAAKSLGERIAARAKATPPTN